jgi:hypothetical protein
MRGETLSEARASGVAGALDEASAPGVEVGSRRSEAKDRADSMRCKRRARVDG